MIQYVSFHHYQSMNYLRRGTKNDILKLLVEMGKFYLS